MNTKRLIERFLLAFLIFGIFLIPSAIFNLSFVRFLLTNVPYLVIIGAFSLIFSFTIRKNKKIGGFLIILCFSFISFIMIVINSIENQEKEKVKWNSPNDSFIIDFVVGSKGYIYLEASVNDTSGLFLFDTGAGISIVNEKFVVNKKRKLNSHTLTDSQGIQQTKDLFKVNNFVLGDIQIERLQVYPKDSITWTDTKGFFYNQDSIIGIIGNNIISKYIWDFDLINKKVKISKSKRYCRAIHDSLSVPLFWNNGNKDIPVKINGADRMLTFDFGASMPLSISDSIPYKLSSKRGTFSQSTIGAFNHLDSTARKESNIAFVDVELGTYKFNDIQCNENAHSDLLGLPFIWAFERVIVDYLNDRVYFLNENRAHGFSVTTYNRENFLNSAKVIEMTTKPEGMVLILSNDSIETRHVFYGRLTLYKGSKLDSIIFQDSVLMANGRIMYGPKTMMID